MQDIVFFDIDGTLTSGNMQLTFLSFLRKKGIIKTNQYIIVAIQYILSLLGFSSFLRRAFELALSGLKGKTREELLDLIKDFLKSEMPEPYSEAISIINKHKDAGRHVVLLTAIVEPVASAIANKVGAVDVIGTHLELQDGIYTGHITGSIMHGVEKVTGANKYLQKNGVDWSYAWAYADSTSDVPLLKKVKYAFAINPSNKMQKNLQQTACTVLLFT